MGKGGGDYILNKSWTGDDSSRSVGRTGGASVAPEEGVSCANLSGVTVLASPDEHEIKKLRAGDKLNVDCEGDRIVAKTTEGKIAGTLLTPIHGKLILCIQQGYEYQVEVLGIDGAMCRVRVYCSKVK